MNALLDVRLSSSAADTESTLYRCYEALVKAGFVPADELPLLQAWLDDQAGLNVSLTTP